MSTKISFASFLLLFADLPVVMDCGLMFDMGLVTAVLGAVDLENMLKIPFFLGLTSLPPIYGWMTTASLTVYCLIFSVAINCG